jgi:hypothetical protein
MKETRIEKATLMFAKIDAWKESGLTKGEFTSKHGISKSTFEYWIQKKRKQSNPKPQFIELIPEAISGSAIAGTSKNSKLKDRACVELAFPNGLCIKVFM